GFRTGKSHEGGLFWTAQGIVWVAIWLYVNGFGVGEKRGNGVWWLMVINQGSCGMAKSMIIVPSELNQARPSTTSAPATGMTSKGTWNYVLLISSGVDGNRELHSKNCPFPTITGKGFVFVGAIIKREAIRAIRRNWGVYTRDWVYFSGQQKQRPSALLFCSAFGDKREKGRGVRGLRLGRMPEVVVCAVVELLWGVEGFVGVERGGLRGLLVELEK
nr:hypothetical protein [Tanacetum cinerariifolium]